MVEETTAASRSLQQETSNLRLLSRSATQTGRQRRLRNPGRRLPVTCGRSRRHRCPEGVAPGARPGDEPPCGRVGRLLMATRKKAAASRPPPSISRSPSISAVRRPLAASLRAQRGKPVTLDASAVERLGGQCLQILLAAARAWSADGAAFHIASPSSAFARPISRRSARPSKISAPGSLQS